MPSKSAKAERGRSSKDMADTVPSERGPSHDKDSERALKKAAKAAKNQVTLGAEGSDKLEKSKKRKNHHEADVNTDVVPKKHKKPKAVTELTGVTSEDEEAARQEKKRRRKEKKARETEEAHELDKESKQKTEKYAKKSSKKETTRVTSKAKHVASADQWNPDALSGDAARKNKFLRLLGAGKGSGIETSSKSKQQAGVQDIQKVESELERQFAAGVRMKHDGQGKRRGLGM